MNSKCQCKKSVDMIGLHLITGCNSDGTRTVTHDRITSQVQTILNYTGCTTKWAELVFHSLDPDNNKKPDLTVYNMAGNVTYEHV